MSSVYKLDNIMEAYREVENGHIRGKVVVEMADHTRWLTHTSQYIPVLVDMLEVVKKVGL